MTIPKFFRGCFTRLGSLLISRSSRERILQSQVDLLRRQLEVVIQRHAAAVSQFNDLTQLIANSKAKPCPQKGRCAIQSGPLLEFVRPLADCGGAIVCTSACSEMEIAFAVAEGRMWIDPETNIGYVRRMDKWRRLAEAALRICSANPGDKEFDTLAAWRELQAQLGDTRVP